MKVNSVKESLIFFVYYDVINTLKAAKFYIHIMMFLTFRLAPRDWQNPHPCNPKPETLENIWNLKNCFWLTLGSITCQGCDILPR